NPASHRVFEASVGGRIPIIRPMDQCLAANNIEGVAGILNGTTNFILTKMIEEGMSFDGALKLAQDNGYAEKDPTADIEGFDACRKVCILASLAFGKHVYPNQVETEGITNITLEDVAYISSVSGVIKLLGQIKYLNENEIAAFVSPAVVFKGSQLASVNGVFNAILVRGDAVGDVCFYGPGAGKYPTASAVVADMVDAAKHTRRRKIFGWDAGSESYVIDHRELISMPFYVRAKAGEGEIKRIFGDVKFLTRTGKPADESAFITDSMTENALRKKLEALNVINIIKVTDY
nr:homoserine dehydrogenase [Eubacterium sp.]